MPPAGMLAHRVSPWFKSPGRQSDQAGLELLKCLLDRALRVSFEESRVRRAFVFCEETTLNSTHENAESHPSRRFWFPAPFLRFFHFLQRPGPCRNSTFVTRISSRRDALALKRESGEMCRPGASDCLKVCQEKKGKFQK